jgi:dethiobiotin synthetase
MHGLLITATDTGAGKTYLTCTLARQLSLAGVVVGCYKPVCTGGTGPPQRPQWDDVEALADSLGHRYPGERICPQRFRLPLAPPSAAAAEGREVSSHGLRAGVDWWTSRVELLLVEGVGGLLCPITSGETVADLAAELNFPLIVVAGLRLGMINHTLLTCDVARSRGLKVQGIVLNEPAGPSDPQMLTSAFAEISSRSDGLVLGVLRFGADQLQRSPDGPRMDWRELVPLPAPAASTPTISDPHRAAAPPGRAVPPLRPEL